MSHPPIPKTPERLLPEPGVAVIPSVNWEGLKTLYLKEVRRFFKVQLQTIWAPAMTTLDRSTAFTLWWRAFSNRR